MLCIYICMLYNIYMYVINKQFLYNTYYIESLSLYIYIYIYILYT